MTFNCWYPTKNTKLLACYKPSSLTISQEAFKFITQHYSFAVVGYFSARHVIFGFRISNTKGNIPMQKIMNSDAQVNAPDTLTYYRTNSSGSIEDIVLVRKLNIRNIQTQYALNSDHLPVTRELTAQVCLTPPKMIRDYQYTN